MVEQTDGEQVKGTLRLELGGTVHRVTVLPIRAADQWIAQLQASVGRTADAASDTDDIIELARLTTHAAVDLIVAYDRAGVLDREWILDNATSPEVSEALEVLRTSALPFGRAVLSMIDVFRMAAVVKAAGPSRPPSSTNGHSPPGASPLVLSRTRSRTRSSTSSGKRARGA